MPPSDFNVLLNILHKNPFLKIAHSTGCETDVLISLSKIVAFKFTRIEPLDN